MKNPFYVDVALRGSLRKTMRVPRVRFYCGRDYTKFEGYTCFIAWSPRPLVEQGELLYAHVVTIDWHFSWR